MYYNSLGGFKPQQIQAQALGGGGGSANPRPMRLAQAYVPIQKFENLFSAEDALKNGTIFIDLFKASEGDFTRV